MTNLQPAFWSHQHGQPLVVAHRGASALAHENSARAFALAVCNGANAVEADVRRTADGMLVCLHDPDLLRLAGDSRLVCELAFEEILAAVPETLTLAQVIAVSAPLGLLLDVKLTTECDLDAMLDLIGRVGSQRILVGLRNVELARYTREILPDASILAFSPPQEFDHWSAFQPEWFRFWEADASSQNIARAKALGMKVAVMVGEARVGRPLIDGRHSGDIDKEGLLSIVGRGADAILLDDPRVASGLMFELADGCQKTRGSV